MLKVILTTSVLALAIRAPPIPFSVKHLGISALAVSGPLAHQTQHGVAVLRGPPTAIAASHHVQSDFDEGTSPSDLVQVNEAFDTDTTSEAQDRRDAQMAGFEETTKAYRKDKQLQNYVAGLLPVAFLPAVYTCQV